VLCEFRVDQVFEIPSFYVFKFAFFKTSKCGDDKWERGGIIDIIFDTSAQ
jgi:hypothetical protein